MEITIRQITREDKVEWLRMRRGVWPEAPDEYLDYDMDDILSSDKDAVFFALDGDTPVGMIEAHLRESAEGCFSYPVGYIEAWFVEERLRGRGVAGALTDAAESWAREKGCKEMASDTWLDNETSIRAHAKNYIMQTERDAAFFALRERKKQLEASNRKLQQLSMLDGLTGIANRRHFDMSINDELKNAASKESPLSLILIDIDYFKRFNDTYGHQGGL